MTPKGACLKRVTMYAAFVIALAVARTSYAQQFEPGQRVTVRNASEDIEVEVVRQDRYGVLVEYPRADGQITGTGDRRYFQPHEVTPKGAKREDLPVPPVVKGDGEFQGGEDVFVTPGVQELKGRVVRQDKWGVLVAFPSPDGQYRAGGQQQYFQPKDVRRAAKPQPNPNPDRGPEPKKPEVGGNRTPVADAPEGPPLTAEDVLGYLKERIGSDPLFHPKKVQVLEDLKALIRKRGVGFNYRERPDFEKAMNVQGDNDQSIREEMYHNVGAPVKLDWVMGAWDLFYATTSRDRLDDRWVSEEHRKGTNGVLTIKPDKTYVWANPAGGAGDIAGTWREATSEEMRGVHKGGAGIVLNRALGGGQWLIKEHDLVPSASDKISLGNEDRGGYPEVMRGYRR